MLEYNKHHLIWVLEIYLYSFWKIFKQFSDGTLLIADSVLSSDNSGGASISITHRVGVNPLTLRSAFRSHCPWWEPDADSSWTGSTYGAPSPTSNRVRRVWCIGARRRALYTIPGPAKTRRIYKVCECVYGKLTWRTMTDGKW